MKYKIYRLVQSEANAVFMIDVDEFKYELFDSIEEAKNAILSKGYYHERYTIINYVVLD